jgi:hypothetical protein
MNMIEERSFQANFGSLAVVSCPLRAKNVAMCIHESLIFLQSNGRVAYLPPTTSGRLFHKRDVRSRETRPHLYTQSSLGNVKFKCTLKNITMFRKQVVVKTIVS